MDKLWANSGDSHFIEPEDLWEQILPASLANRMPHSVIDGDEEIVTVDGESFRRQLPRLLTKRTADGMTVTEMATRAPGARDLHARLQDLDEEGIWAEVIYPSLGLWQNLIKDPELLAQASRAQNEWFVSGIQNVAPDRFIPAAQLPILRIEDAVAELRYAKSIGLHAINLPITPPVGTDDYNRDYWQPLWAAAEEEGLVLAFHIGSATGDQVKFRGPGGAVLNYVETTYTGQRVATTLVACGALDCHADLRILISEGGATWVPFVGDRMEEAYRQHAAFVRPTLQRPPKQILMEQVFTSFQHDETAVAAYTAMGYQNVLWGSDYPHMEGTYGHTQKTLHQLFDEVDTDVRLQITQENFRRLFPHIGRPPGADASDPI